MKDHHQPYQDIKSLVLDNQLYTVYEQQKGNYHAHK